MSINQAALGAVVAITLVFGASASPATGPVGIAVVRGDAHAVGLADLEADRVVAELRVLGDRALTGALDVFGEVTARLKQI